MKMFSFNIRMSQFRFINLLSYFWRQNFYRTPILESIFRSTIAASKIRDWRRTRIRWPWVTRNSRKVTMPMSENHFQFKCVIFKRNSCRILIRTFWQPKCRNSLIKRNIDTKQHNMWSRSYTIYLPSRIDRQTAKIALRLLTNSYSTLKVYLNY